LERKANIDFDRLKYSLTGEYEEVVLEKQLKEKDKEIERLGNIVNEIRNVVNNEKVSGIEAKLIIKDILDKEYKL
jgi:hypothetical protein